MTRTLTPDADAAARGRPGLPPDPRTEDHVDLSALGAALLRRKWLIAAIAALSVFAGAYYAFVVATPMFRASAVVVLETDRVSVVDLQGALGGLSGEAPEVNTEVEILRARSLMASVVEELGLEDDPEFNPTLRPPGLRARVSDFVRTTVFGQPPPEETPALRGAEVRDRVVSGLRNAVSVRNLPQTYVFEVTVSTTGAQKSARIANAITETYIARQLDEKLSAMEEATTWLSGRVAELRVQLEEAEAERAAFSASTDLVSQEALVGLERQLKDTRDRIASTAEQTAGQRARLAALRAASTPAEQAAAADDTRLNQLLPRIADNDELRATFDTRFGQIVQRAELEVSRLERQQVALRQSEAEVQASIESQSEDLIRLRQLTRESEALALLYESLLTRLNEMTAQRGIQQSDSRVLSAAVVPGGPAEPRKLLILAAMGLLGLVLGGSAALWLELRQDGFLGGQDLQRAVGLPVIGEVPVIPARTRRKTLAYMRDKPVSMAAEAIRTLRTSLLMSRGGSASEVLVMTSAMPGEGKTTVALTLADSLAGAGRSVIVVEGDIRRRTFAQYFGDLPERGLVSVLDGALSLDDAIVRPDNFGAHVLPGESVSSSAADIYSSPALESLIAELRTRYDYIIVDAPPVLVVPDARIIAAHADGILFTVRWKSTSREVVSEAMRYLADQHDRIRGAVLTQINRRGQQKYGYRAYGAYGARYYSN